jgi:alpha-1,2-mannosyltransferase
MLDISDARLSKGQVLGVLVLIRSVAAMVTYITDCDETFNYWEPLHYVLHGFGMQTWEYSPLYGLRSYAFLMPYGLPAWAAAQFTDDKVVAFYAVRGAAGLVCAYCEATLYDAVRR